MRVLPRTFDCDYFEGMSNQELGRLLRLRRQSLGLSRGYVAELAGVSLRQLLEWEAGRGNPGFVQLQGVLQVLGLGLTIESIRQTEIA